MTSDTITTHRITLPDGRTVAIDDRGPHDDAVVVFHHAAPGSRLFDPDPAATAAAGVRLLTVDRPGYGLSSPPAPGAPSIAAMVDDVAFALDSLGVGEVAVGGWSNGGLHALGLAARHPERVRVAALFATPTLDEEVPWVGDDYRAQIAVMRGDAVAGRDGLAHALAPTTVSAEDAVGQVGAGDADERMLADPAVRARVVAMLDGAFAQGALGTANDIVAANVVPWAFDPAAVGAPVHLYYGEADPLVTTAHAQWWEGVLADAHRHDVADAGHLVVVPAWRDFLARCRSFWS
jgi:pimeloyl-ACP methyl ester carboxylesterase